MNEKILREYTKFPNLLVEEFLRAFLNSQVELQDGKLKQIVDSEEFKNAVMEAEEIAEEKAIKFYHQQVAFLKFDLCKEVFEKQLTPEILEEISKILAQASR